METYKPSELILHTDGSIYHLRLKPEHLAKNVIIVGDPQRVGEVSKYFDHIEFKTQNREIITHTGNIGNTRVTVMSSGMGTDNIDIIVHELDALVNINLETRMRKEEHTSLNIMRLGTSGAIQPNIPLNSFIVSEYGLGLDGLLHFYTDPEKKLNNELSESFIAHSNWPTNLPRPYGVRSSDELLSTLGEGFIRGITITAPGFYGPQGRVIRLGLSFPEMNQTIESFQYMGMKVANFEMETSALYGLSKLLGHKALTVCAAIANRATGEHNPMYKIKMEELIVLFLKRIENNL